LDVAVLLCAGVSPAPANATPGSNPMHMVMTSNTLSIFKVLFFTMIPPFGSVTRGIHNEYTTASGNMQVATRICNHFVTIFSGRFSCRRNPCAAICRHRSVRRSITMKRLPFRHISIKMVTTEAGGGPPFDRNIRRKEE
jgi:hypothetical protein